MGWPPVWPATKSRFDASGSSRTGKPARTHRRRRRSCPRSPSRLSGTAFITEPLGAAPGTPACPSTGTSKIAPSQRRYRLGDPRVHEARSRARSGRRSRLRRERSPTRRRSDAPCRRRRRHRVRPRHRRPITALGRSAGGEVDVRHLGSCSTRVDGGEAAAPFGFSPSVTVTSTHRTDSSHRQSALADDRQLQGSPVPAVADLGATAVFEHAGR